MDHSGCKVADFPIYDLRFSSFRPFDLLVSLFVYTYIISLDIRASSLDFQLLIAPTHLFSCSGSFEHIIYIPVVRTDLISEL